MQDQETNSQWSHMLGRAMAGPLKGTSLDLIPCVMTDWRQWLESHPDTTVTILPRTAPSFTREMIRDPSRFVLCLVRRGESRFWQFDRLLRQGVVNDQFEGLDLVVVYDGNSRSATAWNRQLDDQLLSFHAAAGKIVDSETQSTWDLQRGKAIEGTLAGKQLLAVPAVVSFREAWMRFHPETTEWKP